MSEINYRFANGKLPNVKIKVKPIFRNDGLAPIGHEANFLFGSATYKVSLPLSRAGKGMLVNPFKTDEEREYLEKVLGVPLNPYGKESYFRGYNVTLGNETKELNLKEPVDYLNFLILSANESSIRPVDTDYGSREQKYQMVSENFEQQKSIKKANSIADAYMAFGGMKNSKPKLRSFLRAYGKRVNDTHTLEFMQAEIQSIIQADLPGFLKISNNPNYEKIVFVEDAVNCGAIVKKNNKYTNVDGTPLALDGKLNNLEGAIAYLFDDDNQAEYLIIKDRIENSK